MKLNIAKFAMIGACALAIGLHSNDASAQTTFQPGVPQAFPITATVSNAITATVTPPTFGSIGVIRSATAASIATLTLAPTGGPATVAPVGGASFVAGPGATVGSVAITGGFPATDIHITYSALVDLTCGSCAGGNPVLTLKRVYDNLTGTAGSTIVGVGAATVVGTGQLSGAGALTFQVGAVLETTVGPVPYESGAYLGSFSAMLQY